MLCADFCISAWLPLWVRLGEPRFVTVPLTNHFSVFKVEWGLESEVSLPKPLGAGLIRLGKRGPDSV